MTITLPILDDAQKTSKRRGLGSIEGKCGERKIKLPLASVAISARVADRLAHVTVTECFSNPFGDHLEAVYIFPLSGGCAVSSFQMKVGDRIIEGLVEERQAAREQYALALQEGKRAALLEQERDDVFTVQVGNLPPDEEITVTITYSEKLPYFDQGLTEIRLPLVVAPRYIPGTPLDRDSVGDGVELDTNQVPDASRITPPRLANGVKANIDLKISVDIDAVETIEDVSCSQHATRLGASKRGVSISLARVDELLDRDFVLRWRVATDKVESKFLIFQGTTGDIETGAKEKAGVGNKKQPKRDQGKDDQGDKQQAQVAEGEQEHFGMISLMPPAGEDIARPARDVVFVLDHSGSMQGIKMVSAARACSFLLATLGPEDRFAIEAFDNSTEWMTAADGSRFFDADEAGLDAGYKFLRKIQAAGGTELQGALDQAIAAVDNNRKKSKRMSIIVVLTDGEVGNEAGIIQYIQRRLGDSRVFTVGIDTAVNDGFLRKLAAIGGGTSTFVEPGTELEAALSHVGREIGSPLITDLSIEDINCDVDIDSLAPNRLPDLFEGRAVSVFFRLSAAKLKDLSTAKLRLKGRHADGSQFSTEVSATTTTVESLPQLWARSRVVDLEDKYRLASGRNQEKLKEEIVALAVKHSLLTKFTAFVVVDHAEIVNKDGLTRKIVQPVQNPASWQDQAVPAPMPASGGWGSPPPMMGGIGHLAQPLHMPQHPQGVPQSPLGGGLDGSSLNSLYGSAPRSKANQPAPDGASSWDVSTGQAWGSGAEQGWGSPPSAPAPGTDSQADPSAASWGSPLPGAGSPPAGGSPPQPAGSKIQQAGPPLDSAAGSKMRQIGASLDKQAKAAQAQQAQSSPPQPASSPSPTPNAAPTGSPLHPRYFPKLSDDAVDKLFSENLGVSSQAAQPMQPPRQSPPPAPQQSPMAGSGGWFAGAGADGSIGAGGAKPNPAADWKLLQASFAKFGEALKLVLNELAAGRLPDAEKLDSARLDLLTVLSTSSLADKLPQLQKYLRADVLHLIAALWSAKTVIQKLKVLAAEQSQKFEEIEADISKQVEEENRPFWGLTV